ncbi:MAG: formylmethanofuran dehydrogenase subunit A, partial [Promethearchaeota archaeon]
MDLLIKDGFVYDPLNGINGDKVDICVSNGKIVEQCAQDAKVINAANKIVMPGGIDIHTHVAGSNLTSGRGLRPEDMRLGIKPATTFLRAESGNTMPNTFATGHRYIEMGYTMICQPGMPPIKGRETHEELSDIPFVDKTAMTLCEKNWFILRYFREKQFEEAKNFLAWLLWATKGSATKLVNPGGTEAWGFGKNVKSLDDVVPHFDITPREIITGFQRINEDLGLHHSIHLHLNQLGKPGNYQIALDTFRALEDISAPSHLSRTQSAHITHVQFSAFGGTSWRDFCSAADSIAEYINHHDHLTLDSGAVVFGPATTLTADGPVQYDIGNLTRLKWANSDVELETGAGIVPFVYDPKSLTSSIQWAIGLELYLLIKDPWKIMMSTD